MTGGRRPWPAPLPASPDLRRSHTNTTALFYRDRARQAEADANAATLDNVRSRWLRAAKAWDEMASRAEKTAERRSVNEEAKMVAEMMEDD